MIAQPKVSIVNIGEPFSDAHGQHWSPATIEVTWAPVAGLHAPGLTVSVIAPARPDMTIEELRQGHLAAMREVLTAAALATEEPPSPVKETVSESR